MSETSRIAVIKQRLLDLIRSTDDDRGKSKKAKSPFEVELDELLQEYPDVTVGRLQMINLRDLITKKNADKKLIARALDVTMEVIDENLHPGEKFVRHDEISFGLLFPGMTKSASELRCSVIADQIVRRLHEDNDAFTGIGVGKTVQTIDREMFKRRYAAPNERRVARGVRDHRDFQKYKEREKDKKLATAIMANMADEKDDGTDDDATAATPAWVLEQLGAQESADDSLPAGLDIAYRPVWHVRNKLLTAYRAHPTLPNWERHEVLIDDMSVLEEDSISRSAVDRHVLGHAIRCLDMLIGKGHPVLMIVPVSFDTLSRENTLIPFVQEIARLKESLRHLMVLEIVGMPVDLSTFRIKDLTARLRTAARARMAQVPLDTPVKALRDAGLLAVGFDCVDWPLKERDLLPAMDRFASDADKCGLQSFVYGLDTRSKASAAVAAGFGYIEGPIVRPASPLPRYIEPFESKDLFAGLLSG